MSAPFGRPVLIVPGLNGSGPQHWQTRWQALHPEFQRLSDPGWARADLERWSAGLRRALRRLGRPALVVAHSFGCLATVRLLARDPELVAGALLVAPASPARFGLEDGLRLEFNTRPTLVIASENDPWLSCSEAFLWSLEWGSQLVVSGRLGHINADSGLGDWPRGLELLRELDRRAEAGTLRAAA